MKYLTTITLTIALVGNAVARTDTCESMVSKELQRFYQVYVLVEPTDTSHKYLSYFFSVEDVNNLDKFLRWARSEGFDTEIKEFHSTVNFGERNSSYTVLVEKSLDAPSFSEFSSMCWDIWEKRLELGIAQCNGTGKGVGMRMIKVKK